MKLIFISLLFLSNVAFSQGVGIPSKHWGLGFGNLERFTGIRFNIKDKHVDKITGVNTTIWTAKNDEDNSGTVNGLSIGLPLSGGHANQNGASVGVGVAVRENLSGVNIGVLGVGAGSNMTGLNVAGLGLGSGGNISGITLAGLGAGSGGDVSGFTFGGLGIGAGGRLLGCTIGGLGVGSGESISGFTVAGVGIGSGEGIDGFSAALGGIGSGDHIRGITVAGLGIGAGEDITGITAALLGIGSPKVQGLAAAAVVGGLNVKGIIIAPAFFRVGGGRRNDNADEEGVMTGLSVSAYNRIIGEQKGVTFGIVNYTRRLKGFQFGVINIVKENPRGLRVLPIFNARFGKGS